MIIMVICLCVLSCKHKTQRAGNFRFWHYATHDIGLLYVVIMVVKCDPERPACSCRTAAAANTDSAVLWPMSTQGSWSSSFRWSTNAPGLLDKPIGAVVSLVYVPILGNHILHMPHGSIMAEIVNKCSRQLLKEGL